MKKTAYQMPHTTSQQWPRTVDFINSLWKWKSIDTCKLIGRQPLLAVTCILPLVRIASHGENVFNFEL